MNRKLIVISGFSGAGKGMLTQMLAARHDCLEVIRSCTTRPRRNETEHYTYLSEEDFLAMRKDGAFLECNCYLGRWYGTPKSEVRRILDEGKQAIAEIDYHGFFQILEHSALPREEICGIFVAAEADALYHRLNARGSESFDTLLRRLRTAMEESTHLSAYDCVVVNDDLFGALKQCEGIILRGRLPVSSFDAARFCADMQAIITRLETDHA